MNMKQWLLDLRLADVKKAMPILSFPSVHLLDVQVRQLVTDSSLQAEGMKRVAERTDSAASVSMMDLSVEAEAFGSEILMSDEEVPTVVGALVKEPEDADALTVPSVGAGRTGVYVEAIQKAKQSIKDRPVLAGIIGPFSLAGRLMGVTDALVNCYTEPEMVHTVLKKATSFLKEYAKAYRSAGADGIVMAEPLTGLLSPEMAEEFSEPYVREIFDSVKNDEFLVVYHNCGDRTPAMIESILRTGAPAYHFGNSVSMKEMLSKIPQEFVVMGNIDPAGEFCNGTPESIRAATLQLLEEYAKEYPNFIISSGCDIPPASRWENIDSFFRAVKEYYSK